MSNIDKQAVQAVADLKAGYTLGHADVAILNELARIALASLEAEPVCYLTWHQGFRAPDDCEEYVVEAKPGDKSCDGSPAFPVYAAQPAPVSESEPVAWASEEALAEVCCGETGMIGLQYMVGNIPLYLHAQHAPVVPDEMPLHTGPREFGRPPAYVDGWNACRAAMLQGAEPVSNRDELPGGWVACSERLPEETKEPDGGATGYLVLYAEGKEPNGGFNVGVWNVTYLRQWWRGFITHWQPLPAAPQQEAE
ncbi:DUF551 domain-containing protein [Citrobacter sedlakii]|uniref:DUF551 domain-containing protein n=1 Tax=Citrobacter sedlakii TaxID=67826 RepID=UPI002B228E95|nr:DUF551 domain-containing protein [Citrobacter sedlakii]MEB0949323.1 DUF551 domain-containing protein [Citrobacter sedlakii]